MKGKIFFLSFMLMLTLIVVMGLVPGIRPLAASLDTLGNTSASVSSGFTYQGRLEDGSGNPVNDTCDLDFTLWNAENSGMLIGHQIVTGVEVNDGYFTVLLNSGDEFGADAFEGEARWLKIGVKCSGDTGWNLLSGRQLLSATPYALSLRPGAVISGTVSGGASLTVTNQATSGESNGIYGRSDSTDGYGGYFDNTAGGTALYAAGDVAQDASAAGLVKAAVYANCASSGWQIHRSFNTVSGHTTIFGLGGPGIPFQVGACVLDFNFDLSERYWIAMAYNDTNATIISCTLSTSSNDTLICKRWYTDGTPTNGDIMVLIY